MKTVFKIENKNICGVNRLDVAGEKIIELEDLPIGLS